MCKISEIGFLLTFGLQRKVADEVGRTRTWYELQGGQPVGYEGEEDVFIAYRCLVHKWREWRFHVFEKVGEGKKYTGIGEKIQS